MPHFSIITPTLVRPTLVNACHSVDTQRCSDYEHLVVVDIPQSALTPNQRNTLTQIAHPQRRIYFCPGAPTRNYGNTPRHLALKHWATGRMSLLLDDDDTYCDSRVLDTLCEVTAAWGIFPILRNGRPYTGEQTGFLGNGSLIFRPRIVDYPTTANYCDDRAFVDRLSKAAGPPQRLKCRPLLAYNTQGLGDNMVPITKEQLRQDKALLDSIETMPSAVYRQRLKSDGEFAAAIESAYVRQEQRGLRKAQ